MQVFDPQKREKAGNRTCVLILDGHSSHYTKEFLTYACDNNIILLGYPPHCTHALQGLDVVCFGKMKEIWKRVINKFEQEHQRAVTKNDFTFLFGTAYKEAFDRKTIKAAFRVTGVYPFNRTVITDSRIKPSMPTSVRGEFPLLQPSPVRVVLAAMDMNPHSPANTNISSVQSGPKRMRDPNIDPVLYSNSPSPSPK